MDIVYGLLWQTQYPSESVLAWLNDGCVISFENAASRLADYQLI